MVGNGASHIGALKHFLGDIYPLMQRKDITDIEINARGEFVWIDGSNGREKTDIKIDREKMYSFLYKIASMKNSSITEEHPTLSAILPVELFECRLEATVPPVVVRPGPSIVIRKPGDNFPITDYVNDEVRRMLIKKMKGKANILICGSTSSGKTSFLNSLLKEFEKIQPLSRVLILEDEQELDCPFANHEYLLSVTKENVRSWSMTDSVKKSLRKNPDLIVAGEVRDKEAKEVFHAWTTGHSGCCTLHAGGARQGFMRFFGLAGLSWNNETHRMTAGEVIDSVLFLSKGPDGRKVREIVSVNVNYDSKKLRPEFTHMYPTKTKPIHSYENHI